MSIKRSFSLPIDPADLPTAQQKGVRLMTINGRSVIQHYTKTKVERAADRLLSALIAAADGNAVPGTPDTDWFINVVFVYRLPKSYSKRMYGKYKRTRPDGDNLIKMLNDVITRSGLFWQDDAQAQIQGVFRRWQTEGEEPRILISISANTAIN